MPKSEKNTRPYNRNEKTLAKGEAARRKAVLKGKASGSTVSAGQSAQIRRKVRKEGDDIWAEVNKGGTVQNYGTNEAGGKYRRGKDFEKGKKTKVRGSLSSKTFVNSKKK